MFSWYLGVSWEPLEGTEQSDQGKPAVPENEICLSSLRKIAGRAVYVLYLLIQRSSFSPAVLSSCSYPIRIAGVKSPVTVVVLINGRTATLARAGVKYTSGFPYKFHFPGQKFCLKGRFEDICLACVGISELKWPSWKCEAPLKFDRWCIVSLILSGSDRFMVHTPIISVCSRFQNTGKTREHLLTSCCPWDLESKYGSPINTGKLRHGEDAYKTVRNGETSYGSCLWKKLCISHVFCAPGGINLPDQVSQWSS